MLSVPAFTGAIGAHSRSEPRVSRQWGKLYTHTIDEIVSVDDVTVAFSDKPEPIHGNRHMAYDYYRTAQNLVIDKPFITRRHAVQSDVDPENFTIDLWTSHWISTFRTLGSYYIGDDGATNAFDKSVNDALNGLTGGYASMGENMGQARQTCDEFAKVALRTGNFLRDLKRGNFKDSYRWLFGINDPHYKSPVRTIADWWLTYSYGFKPLASDLIELQHAAHRALDAPVFVNGNGKGHSDRNLESTYEGPYDFVNKVKYGSSHRTSLIAKVTNPALAGLSSAGLINPLSIAWELVPFSFVIDWFIPVGNTLQAITAGVGLEYVGGYTSSHYGYETRINVRESVDHDGSGVIDGGDYLDLGHTFRRVAHNHLPLPRIYANERPYSTTRALNALAVVAGLQKD